MFPKKKKKRNCANIAARPKRCNSKGKKRNFQNAFINALPLNRLQRLSFYLTPISDITLIPNYDFYFPDPYGV